MAGESVGFTVYGDAGNLQIDQNFINLVCVSKGVITLAEATTNAAGIITSPASTLSINDVEYPMLFMCPRNLYVTIDTMRKNGNNASWNLYGWARGNNGTGPEAVPYWIFDLQPNIPCPAGITVWKEDGRVAFNSDYPPMRMRAMFPVPYTSPGVLHSASGGSGNYAGMIPVPYAANSRSSDPSGPGTGRLITQGFKLVNGKDFMADRVALPAPPIEDQGANAGIGIIIDVGNI